MRLVRRIVFVCVSVILAATTARHKITPNRLSRRMVDEVIQEYMRIYQPNTAVEKFSIQNREEHCKLLKQQIRDATGAMVKPDYMTSNLPSRTQSLVLANLGLGTYSLYVPGEHSAVLAPFLWFVLHARELHNEE